MNHIATMHEGRFFVLDGGLVTRKEWLQRRAPLLERLDAARADLARENGTGPLQAFQGVNVTKRWASLPLDERRKVAALTERFPLYSWRL